MHAHSLLTTVRERRNGWSSSEEFWFSQSILAQLSGSGKQREDLLKLTSVEKLYQRLETLRPQFCSSLVWELGSRESYCAKSEKESDPELCRVADICAQQFHRPAEIKKEIEQECASSLNVEQLLAHDALLAGILSQVKQNEEAFRLAQADRESKLAHAEIKGLGLDTPREQFLRMTSRSHDVWSCETHAQVEEAQTCVGTILPEHCEVRPNPINGLPFNYCQVMVPAAEMMSPELKAVSTIGGDLVRSITVSFFQGKVAGLAFIMSGALTDGTSGQGDVRGALREKFGEPVTQLPGKTVWEANDTRLSLLYDQSSRATIELQQPSLLAARSARLKAAAAAEDEAQQRQAESKRKDI